MQCGGGGAPHGDSLAAMAMLSAAAAAAAGEDQPPPKVGARFSCSSRIVAGRGAPNSRSDVAGACYPC